MKKIENGIGFVLLIASIILGSVLLKTDMLVFRWIIGIGLGYALTRAFFGFAGSVNIACRTGSTKLMRALMLMFVVSSILTAALLMFGNASSYGLWVNPINIGLILGGLFFGFGMSCSSCCATGTLTDLVTGLPRAFITMVFFGIGIFVGFPLQASKSWIRQSWFTTGEWKGVFIPDWFSGSGIMPYLGAILVTLLFAGIVVALSYLYEKKRKNENNYNQSDIEKEQAKCSEFNTANYKLLSQETYDRLFVKPWSLITGAIVLSILFTFLMVVTKSGWGASTPYGFWFGRVLKFFGVSVDAIASFTMKKPRPYVMPFFEHPIYVQNIGIIMGTLICLLLAGSFTKTFKSELKITVLDIIIFAVGGFAMGIGTRLSNGCNVGALYTPIANFSLSGWIYLIFITTGGVLGNFVLKKIKKN